MSYTKSAVSIVLLLALTGPGVISAADESPEDVHDTVVAGRPESDLRGPVLHAAAKRCDRAAVTAAVDAGEPIDSRDAFGKTALILATENACLLTVEFLVKAGAAPDARGPDGRTALHIAAQEKYTRIVSVLMRAAASISIRGVYDKTPVDVARETYGVKPDTDSEAVQALAEGKMLREVEENRRAERKRKWPLGKSFRDGESCPRLTVVRDIFGGMGMIAVSGKITVQEYQQCVDEKGCEPRLELVGGPSARLDMVLGPGPGSTSDVAVETRLAAPAHVPWTAEQGFDRWVKEKCGGDYRILSNREYEARVPFSDRLPTSSFLGKPWSVPRIEMLNPFEMVDSFDTKPGYLRKYGLPVSYARWWADHELRLLMNKRGFRVAKEL